jgi:acyl carrier protein
MVVQGAGETGKATGSERKSGDRCLTLAEMESQLAIRLAGVIGVPHESIERTRPLETYGLSSLDGLILLGDLEAWLGFEVPPSVLVDHPNLDALAAYLHQSMALPGNG